MEVVLSRNINSFTSTKNYTKQQSDALNTGLKDYTDSKLTDYYTKQESNSAINGMAATKQDKLTLPGLDYSDG